MRSGEKSESQSLLFDARLWGAVAMVFIGAALRIVPHPANVTPIAAIALFGGAYLSRRWLALGIPFLAMLISDSVIGFHDQMVAVYVAFAAATLIGFFLRKRRSLTRIAAATLVSSLVFFVITNFAVWAQGQMYPLTAAGLADCFVMALPFFERSLLGDLFFVSVMFGVWAWAEHLVPQLREA